MTNELKAPDVAGELAEATPVAWLCIGPEGDHELEHHHHTPALTAADIADGWSAVPLYDAATALALASADAMRAENEVAMTDPLVAVFDAMSSFLVTGADETTSRFRADQPE